MFHTGFEFREQRNNVFGMHLSQCECIYWVQLHFHIALLTLLVVLCCMFCESGFLGGIALLTLLVNGGLAGPLLRKLGLADSTADRERVAEGVNRIGTCELHADFVQLLTECRFRDVDFASVKFHIHAIRDFTLDDSKAALQVHEERTPPRHHKVPCLEKLLPHLASQSPNEVDLNWLKHDPQQEAKPSHTFLGEPLAKEFTDCDASRLLELRQGFINLLKSACEHQLNDGDLDGHVGFVAVTLEQGLLVEFAADRVSKGEPLQDWKCSSFLSSTLENRGLATLEQASAMLSRSEKKNEHTSVDHMELRVKIHRALAQRRITKSRVSL